MNSTSPLLNTSILHGMNFPFASNNSNQLMFYPNQNQTIKKVAKVIKIRNNFTDPKYSSRSKRSHLPASIYPSKFEKLMSHVNINDNSTGVNNDPQDNSPKPLQGLKESNFYPEVLTDGKKIIDQILIKLQALHQTEQEKNWEDLTKALKVIYSYQYSTHFDSKEMKIMKNSLENLGHFFSRTPITNKVQFLSFKDWAGISSFDSANPIGFNNLNQAKIYLIKLVELMSSSNQEIQNIVHNYSNVLFRYQFIEKCLDNGCIVKQELLTVIEKTFNLCEKLKGESEYYFIRNALASFEKILQVTEKSAFKNEIIYQLKQGFENLFKKLMPEEKIIVKQLSYLTIKSIKKQNLTSLSLFCQETTIKDIYPYQREIPIAHMRVNVTSALDWNHDLMKQIPNKLQETYSHFIEKFGTVLGVNSQDLIKCNLFVAESKSLYEIFNYILLGKSTGNGGVTECSYQEYLCIPTAAIYIKNNNELWNLEHEFNHILLHLNAGLKVNHPMDKFGKYGRLDWLNEGLSYVLVPNSFMEKNVKRVLIDKGLPHIKDIIEATSQNYDTSYSFVDYLLNKQKTILDKILVYAKDGKEDLLKKELENLNSLERDYHIYLISRWSLPENTHKTTTVIELQPLTTFDKQSTRLDPSLNPITKNLEEGWTPEKGKEAVKKITYGSTLPLGLAISCLVYAIFGISKQKDGKGRDGHNRFKAISRQRYRNEPAKSPEIKLLNNKQEKNRFFRNDSKSLQRKGNT